MIHPFKANGHYALLPQEPPARRPRCRPLWAPWLSKKRWRARFSEAAAVVWAVVEAAGARIGAAGAGLGVTGLVAACVRSPDFVVHASVEDRRHTATYAFWRESAPTQVALRGVSVCGGRVDVVGDRGVILSRPAQAEGAVWRFIDSGSRTRLNAVHCGLAVGEQGSLLARTAGGQWLPESVAFGGTLHDVSGSERMSVAVGDSGTLLLRRDGAWSKIDTGVERSLRAVVVVDESFGPTAYVGGDGGTLLRCVFPNEQRPGGSVACRRELPPGSIDWRIGIKGFYPNFVGTGGLLAELTGRPALGLPGVDPDMKWRVLDTGLGVLPRAITAFNNLYCEGENLYFEEQPYWAVGDRGLLLTVGIHPVLRVTRMNGLPPVTFNAIASAPPEIYAVGDGGSIFRGLANDACRVNAQWD